MNKNEKTRRAVPVEVQDECLQGMVVATKSISEIASGVTTGTVANQIAAFDKLGKFGFLGRTAVLVSDSGLAEFVLRKAKEIFNPTREQYDQFEVAILTFVELKIQAAGSDDVDLADDDSADE